MATPSNATVELGLRQNWRQFTLLVIINAFVGGMVGMERSILPQLAEVEFGIAAKTAILSFIVAFGVAKALANLSTGVLAQRIGRKNLLLLGWALGLPVPFLLMFAPSWGWVVAANLLLGVHQGFAWSATVVMKIDLAGERDRGMAMGLNEFAGYLAVAAAAFASAWLASAYGLRPYPFYLGVGLSVAGILSTWLLVRDTHAHVAAEAVQSSVKRLGHIFTDTTWRHRNLGSVTMTGLVNNLNDGMVWGLLPVLLVQRGMTLPEVGILAAIYPAVWGVGQLFSGRLSDFICKKDLLLWGMLVQGGALLGLAFVGQFWLFAGLLALLGWGTAMVYPTFLASIAENTHPYDQAKSLGVFRFWRDMGYAIGALLTGILADAFGIPASIVAVGVLTLAAGLGANYRMRCRTENPTFWGWMGKKWLFQEKITDHGHR
ncbi:MAG: MFS transporter [Lewinellaceae bacterium]|nr:MFS transporter [Lewinellaceae bacterium]